MKYNTTRTHIKAVYGEDIYAVGYCGAYHLLRGLEPIYYNAGIYGWNCDYYLIGSVCICTGYRPHGKNRPEITSLYEERAKAVYDTERDLTAQAEKLAQIRKEWIQALRG